MYHKKVNDAIYNKNIVKLQDSFKVKQSLTIYYFKGLSKFKGLMHLNNICTAVQTADHRIWKL